MENLLLLIKLQLQKLRSPKYKRKGTCKQCGRCCRELTFRIKDKLITTKKEFEHLKKWQPYYNNFEMTGEDSIGTKLFTCKHLSNDNKCLKYKTRGIFCRQYPFGPETLEGCGYSFTLTKSFKNYINK